MLMLMKWVDLCLNGTDEIEEMQKINKLLNKGIPIDIIEEITGLTKEEIEKKDEKYKRYINEINECKKYKFKRKMILIISLCFIVVATSILVYYLNQNNAIMNKFFENGQERETFFGRIIFCFFVVFVLGIWSYSVYSIKEKK